MASSTRERILAVSLRLFNEQGYRNVTMRAPDRREAYRAMRQTEN